MTQGVIFDMDGVLVASAPAHAASWRGLGRRHGLAITDEQFSATFGQTSRDIIRHFWGEGLSDEQIRALDDEKEQIYRELITGMVPLTVGTREVLQGLAQAGLALAVATSGPPANVDLVMTETNLRPMFCAIVTGADVSQGKPAPDCFLRAAERIDLAPAACVVIEDAPVGIEAAHAAGMKAIGFVGTHSAAVLAAAHADLVASQLREITPEVIRKLLR